MLASNGDVIAMFNKCVAMKTSQSLTNFMVMMPIKQNQELPLCTNVDRTALFFLGQTPLPPPAVQSAGELQQPLGARKTLEPERGRKVQGEKSPTARNWEQIT